MTVAFATCGVCGYPVEDGCCTLAAHPAEPGDMRLEAMERDRDRDEAEQPNEAYGTDPGWVDA